MASGVGWEAMAAGLEQAAGRIQEQTGKLDAQDRLIVQLRAELEVTGAALTERDIEILELNGRLNDQSSARDVAVAKSVTLQSHKASLQAQNGVLQATIRTMESAALLAAKAGHDVTQAGAGVPTSMPTPPTTPPQANEPVEQLGAAGDSGDYGGGPQTLMLGPEPELLNATPKTSPPTMAPLGPEPDLLNLNATPKTPPTMTPLSETPSLISVDDDVAEPRLPTAVHSMHGGDEYGVPTVPTARKMAISVGGVSAPDIKTFLLGPGKTAFVARFKNGEEDSFDSDNEACDVTTAQVSLAAVDKLSTPPRTPPSQFGRDKPKFRRHGSPTHSHGSPTHSTRAGSDDLDQIPGQNNLIWAPAVSTSSSSALTAEKAPAPAHPVYDMLAIDGTLEPELVGCSTPMRPTSHWCWSSPMQPSSHWDGPPDPEPAMASTAVDAAVSPAPCNAAAEAAVPPVPCNAEPEVLPGKSWSNRVFKSVKRTLWSGRAKRGSASTNASSDSGGESTGDGGDEPQKIGIPGGVNLVGLVDDGGFVYDGGLLGGEEIVPPLGPAFESPPRPGKDVTSFDSTPGTPIAHYGRSTSSKSTPGRPCNPASRPTELPETMISSYFAGTDLMGDPDDSWLMSTKTIGSPSAPASPGKLPTRTAHDDRLRLRTQLKAAEASLEQKVKAMQDVKIRAEAIRRERGASQKAAAEVRKAASADKAKAANAANSANASKATCVDKAAVGAGDDGAAKPTTTTTRRKRQQQPVWKLALEKEKEQKRVARKRDEELKTVAMQDVAQKRALRKRNKDLRAGKPVTPIRGKPPGATAIAPPSPLKRNVAVLGSPSTKTKRSLSANVTAGGTRVLGVPSQPSDVMRKTSPPRSQLVPGPARLDASTRIVTPGTHITKGPVLRASSSQVSASPESSPESSPDGPKKPRRSTNI